MLVTYSIDARFGGGGIGHTAFNAVAGIHRYNLLARLFVSSNATSNIPANLIRQWGWVGRVAKYLSAKDASGLAYHFESILFDSWVAVQLASAQVFHGWNSMCLQSLHRAKQRGMVTVVERASAHPATFINLLREEYARWNVPLKLPLWNYARMLAEFEQADYITVPSAFARESMITKGIPARKLIEIPFGVDLARFVPRDETSAVHPFRVIFVGLVSLNKGVPYLLEAWRQLGWQDAELWIVGAMAHDWATICERWTNLPGVNFIPHSNEISRLLQQSDVFVFPSIQEGSALVTYEAMACGLPVITTPNAGSVARDGEDGFIVPIRDVNALCDRLEQLRADDALRQRMGQSARERAHSFIWEIYQDKLVDAYYRITAD